MQKFRVLIFPCGAENALELHDALAHCVNIEVWGASSREDHGRFVFKNYIGGIPYLHQGDFLPAFNDVIRRHKVDVLFPTHDTVTQFLADRRNEIACRVVGPSSETANICREKKISYQLFADCPFAPRVYSTLEEADTLPVFLKPNIGEGSKNTHIARSREEAGLALGLHRDSLIVEYLPGGEITVDCFSDRHGKLRFVGPRARNRVHYGISVNSSALPVTPEIQAIAEEINRRLRLRGLWYFQVKAASDGRLKLMEISARAAGTMCLFRHRGVNLPLLSVYDAMDMEVEIMPEDFEIEVDRALINRFKVGFDYDRIYLDFDDTVLCNGAVHPFVLLLLYQAAREGKPVHLLTRHEADIHQTLARIRLHQGLFAEIRKLSWEEDKCAAIKREGKPIFIDNAFAERKKVKAQFGMPVFDVDAVGCLLDWRS